jgi:hypothetical protein
MDVNEYAQFYVTAKPPRTVKVGQLCPVYRHVPEGSTVHANSVAVAAIQGFEEDDTALFVVNQMNQDTVATQPSDTNQSESLYFVPIKEKEFIAVVVNDTQIQIDEGKWIHEKL